MSIFDQILGQVAGNVDVQNLAAKVGIDPDQAENAIAALAAGHQAKGDTVEVAAANTGLDTGILQQIMGHIGGEGSLGQFASMLGEHPDALQKVSGFLDRDGDGNPINDVMGMAKGLFGGN
ncbi:hypothetical protein RXV95_04965 [Novosphingobium sp. ZN18A2]|uniref:hypothetical protein n=1 Tax=Novosphingobium sp. ZN18A2 TaxID=3079861 RepID=UPI0030D3B462